MNLTIENVINVVCKSINIGKDEISEDISLVNDIGIDSIEIIKLCKDLITEFDCKISVVDLKKADNVKNIFNLLQQQL